jgi:selenocysteine lyase/cysteine desulfurase
MPSHTTLPRSPAAVADQWSPAGVYLNTASYGLPPRGAFDVLTRAMDDWRTGRTSWEQWGDATEQSRALFARLHGVEGSRVAIGATVSELVGLVAAALPDNASVLVARDEFTSLVFPFAAHADRGVRVTAAMPEDLADAVGPATSLVAVSVVQSATGEIPDLAAISANARAVGALVVVDTTQASGWFFVDPALYDVLVCAGYKWLMAPRGTAYLVVNAAAQQLVRPLHAGWYAGADVHSSYYGLPLRLAATARRLDTSPAWFSWVGAAPALALIEQVGVDAINAHNLRLANRFRAGIGLPAGQSAIVTVPAGDAERRLADAGVRASIRNGALRLSFHLYNTDADVDTAVTLLRR